MSFSTSLRISGSALTAQRLRMDVIAGNVANVETTRGEDGGPYRKREVVLRNAPVGSTRFAAMGTRQELTGGVRVAGIAERDGVRLVSNPGHPDADADGFVAYPDIDIVDEMTNMMAAVRAYEASVTVANSAKQMAAKSLEIGRQ